MSQNGQYLNRNNDEITLVDLATIFVRRRYVFYVVFVSVVIMTSIYALFFVGEAKEYTTLLQLGEKVEEGKRQPLEEPATVIATLHSQWLPEQQAVYAEVNGVKMPFGIEADNPKDTALIKLTSTTSPARGRVVNETHQTIVDKIVQRQSRLLERDKQALSHRLEYIDEYLEKMSGEEASGRAAAEAVQQRVQIVAQLNSLQPAEVLVVARESVDNKGTSTLLIVVVGVFLGGMLAFVATFAAEFIVKVRNALNRSEPN